MKKLSGEQVLINRPKKIICKVGKYDISVSSDNDLEDMTAFDDFCSEFRMVLMAMVGSTNKPKTVPTVGHEAMS